MKKKTLMIVFVMIAIALAGCGKEEGKEKDKKNYDDPVNQGIVAGEVMTSIMDKGDGTFEFKVKNQTEKEVEFNFSDGQRYDYSIKTKDGKEIYRYSSDMMFTQDLGKENLKQGEELAYPIDLKKHNLVKGDYVIEAWLTAAGEKEYKVLMDYNIN